MTVLKRNFYNRNTLTVAKDLLGKILCRKLNGKIYKAIIVETEAYTQEDPSCHAYRGKTPRARILFEQAGTVYVYFTYGMYYCMNFVTEKKDRGCAVLIRAVEPLFDCDKKTNGPAKLCNVLNITREFNGLDCTLKTSNIWVEDANPVAEEKIIQTTRIGIKQAADYPWRFYIKDNKFVSKK